MTFVEKLQLTKLSRAEQQEFIGSFTDLVLARLADMIGEHLTDAEIAELESLVNGGDAAKLMNWLNHHIPNLSAGIDEVVFEESEQLSIQANELISAV